MSGQNFIVKALTTELRNKSMITSHIMGVMRMKNDVERVGGGEKYNLVICCSGIELDKIK